MQKQKKVKNELHIERFNTTIDCGLSAVQVEQRKKEKLVNNTKQRTSKSYFRIFFDNIFTFFNFIWIAIFVALLWVKSYTNLFFMAVIITNTAIAIIQEIRSKRTVEKLSMITLPKSTVIRDGKEVEVSSDEIVLDDILVLTVGNQIPTDSIILSGKVEVNESLLTGESKPVKKVENAELFAGSFITSGKCYARANKIGKESYVQSLATAAKKFKQPNSNLFKDLNKIIKWIGIFILPVGALTFVNCYLWTDGVSLAQSIEKTCGSLIGMIPSGMFLLISVALAVGVIKLAQKRTLVQDIYSIEMLARSNVLCLDKTGTITDGTMTVKKVITFENETEENVKCAISAVLSAQNTENNTSKALLKYFGKDCGYKTAYNIPFSSDRKYTATSFEKIGTYAFGASEYLKAKMTDEMQEEIKKATADGYRVLVLATSKKIMTKDELPTDLVATAIILIEDTIREDAIETIKWFKENSVQIKIISGDDPATVSTIAKRVGVDGCEDYINLEGMTIEEVKNIADKYTVFGRVSPEQKHAIIQQLKKNNVVAMTGDGVNDTLALKEADCSIAMADGSEVARNISHLVLLDSKFSSLPTVVEEGRRVINNVQKSSTLFLMKTVLIILLSLILLCAQIPYIFEPKNMFLMELFTIGMPSFFLALLPNKNLIQGDFIPYVLKKSLPYGLLLLFNVLVAVVLQQTGCLLPSEAVSLATISMITCGYLNLISLCIPFNKFKVLICVFSLVGACVASIIMPTFFGLIDVSASVLKIILVLTLFTAILHIWGNIISRIFKKYKGKKKSWLLKKLRLKIIGIIPIWSWNFLLTSMLFWAKTHKEKPTF